MVWFLLSVAGLCEAGFYICLTKAKFKNDTNAAFWFTIFILSFLLCIGLLYKVMQYLPVLEALCIWQGIGITSLILTELFIFKKRLNYWPLLFIILTIGSVIGARLIYENIT